MDNTKSPAAAEAFARDSTWTVEEQVGCGAIAVGRQPIRVSLVVVSHRNASSSCSVFLSARRRFCNARVLVFAESVAPLAHLCASPLSPCNCLLRLVQSYHRAVRPDRCLCRVAHADALPQARYFSATVEARMSRAMGRTTTAETAAAAAAVASRRQKGQKGAALRGNDGGRAKMKSNTRNNKNNQKRIYVDMGHTNLAFAEGAAWAMTDHPHR